MDDAMIQIASFASRLEVGRASLEDISFCFCQVGDGTTIAGLDEGIRGMKEGGYRRFLIPPAIAYQEGHFLWLFQLAPTLPVLFETSGRKILAAFAGER